MQAIGGMLNSSEESVKSLLVRAKHRLRFHFAKPTTLHMELPS